MNVICCVGTFWVGMDAIRLETFLKTKQKMFFYNNSKSEYSDDYL